jgi:hypothetical protein
MDKAGHLRLSNPCCLKQEKLAPRMGFKPISAGLRNRYPSSVRRTGYEAVFEENRETPYGCEILDLHQWSSAYEADEMTTSLIRIRLRAMLSISPTLIHRN